MGHWTPAGVEPKDYDDDVHIHKLLFLYILSRFIVPLYIFTR